MQAVPNMLELVPHGVNKGSGMRKLLADLELPAEVPPLSQNMLSDDHCLLQSVDVILRSVDAAELFLTYQLQFCTPFIDWLLGVITH